MGYGEITVGTTATIIIDGNTQRHSYIITNESANVVFLGQDSSVTTATGIAIPSGSNLSEDSGGTKLYCGPIYGVASASSKVRYWERTR